MGGTPLIDVDFWSSNQSQIFLNPRLLSGTRESICEQIHKMNKEAVLWVKSSGTESGSVGQKMVCIKKVSFLNAAASVNDFFKIGMSDVYLNPLPAFHVGGLAIKARCFLSKAQEVTFTDWSVDKFCTTIKNHGVTLTSLVPTQVYDLVESKMRPAATLRVVLVGGGALSADLYLKAQNLGWPLYPGYGMTETSALMASAPYPLCDNGDPFWFVPLPHVQFTHQVNTVSVSSPGLFEGYCLISDSGEGTWVQRPEPFYLDDQLEFNQEQIKVRGRTSDFVKILGESVSLLDLERQLVTQIHSPVAIIAKPAERKGYNLHLFVEGEVPGFDLLQLNSLVMPYERFTTLHHVEKFPRTELGKIKKSELKRQLQDC